MYQLFETIRVESGQAHFVKYHQQRVDRSVAPCCVSLEGYIATLELPPVGCYKLRITYTEYGIVGHTIAPYMLRKVETLRLIEDDIIEYAKKWTDRTQIERLYAMRAECDDILIVRRGLLTDTSIANIALFDGQRWVTPAQPLLEGTHRARMLENKAITPKNITIGEIPKYPKIALINAMLPFDENTTISIC